MADWLGILALGAPLLHVLLMGLIGYPIAVSRRGGMVRFHRSGFTWWLITLGLIVVLAIGIDPALLAAYQPASALPSIVLYVGCVVGGFLGALLVEVAGAVIGRARRSKRSDRGSARYQNALPAWAAKPAPELVLLGVTALLEEMVYRAIGMDWLMTGLGTGPVVAVLISASAFGLAHWYYGPRQIGLKAVLGAVFGTVSIFAGWTAAAAVHVALNSLLVVLNKRTSVVSGR